MFSKAGLQPGQPRSSSGAQGITQGRFGHAKESCGTKCGADDHDHCAPASAKQKSTGNAQDSRPRQRKGHRDDIHRHKDEGSEHTGRLHPGAQHTPMLAQGIDTEIAFKTQRKERHYYSHKHEDGDEAMPCEWFRS